MKTKIGIFIALIIAAFASIYFFDLKTYLTPEAIKTFISGLGVFGPIVFIAFYAISTLALLPGLPFTVAGGALFGALFGTIYVVIGATIGASLAFLLSRHLGHDFVNRVAKGKFKSLHKYDQKIETNGMKLILFFRLVPLFPFSILNFALGLTKMKFKHYSIGTFVGIIPGTFAYAYFGDSIANISWQNIAIGVTLILVITVISVVLKKKHEESELVSVKIKE